MMFLQSTLIIVILAIGTAIWMWRRGGSGREMPGGMRLGIASAVAVSLVALTFKQVFFYAEPGYIYHG